MVRCRCLQALGVVLAFAITPTFAADHSPWLDRSQPNRWEQLAESGGGKAACCKRCTKGVPCGNTCIAANRKCKSGPGCAC